MVPTGTGAAGLISGERLMVEHRRIRFIWLFGLAGWFFYRDVQLGEIQRNATIEKWVNTPY